MEQIDPIAVALKFGFLAVLYLFLLWVTRSALKDLRRGAGPAAAVPDAGSRREQVGDATGLHSAGLDPAHHPGSRRSAPGPSDPRLVVARAPGHTSGMEYEVGAGAVMGRGDQAEIRLEDPFASSKHARLVQQGGIVIIEDLGSTNGTYLNEELLDGPQPLHPGDRVRIGDSEFVYEDA